ncbi:MAG: HNH endonuclease signature motif containing protein [Dethiobacteraceae bacterium]
MHHFKLLAQGGTNDYDNLRAVCCSCHSSITACDCGRWQRRLK